MTPQQPRDEQDIRDAIAEAAASQTALEIVGGNSKRSVGQPHRQTRALSAANLNKVIDYDPAELILTVQPGVLLAEIQTLVAQHNQMLAFEAFDFARIVDGPSGRSTMGGVVGAGLAGSRRLSAGGVRDHLLGFSAVNGLGQPFKAGGKVVKNVTGYDLPKVMAGSWGQLAVLTELTFKVLPRPPAVRTLAMKGLADAPALAVMTRAVGSQAAVAAASHVPACRGNESITAVRLEGFGPSVDAREQMLRQLLNEFGAVELMDDGEADIHWDKVQTGRHLPAADRPVLWRISLPPARGASMLSAIAGLDGVALLDWAGGLVWARTPLSGSPGAVRVMAEREGGHAMMVDAPVAVRSAMPALHPEPDPVAALSKRLREAFDPAGVFDPQRFVAS